jgi:hypothetical protein
MLLIFLNLINNKYKANAFETINLFKKIKKLIKIKAKYKNMKIIKTIKQ